MSKASKNGGHWESRSPERVTLGGGEGDVRQVGPAELLGIETDPKYGKDNYRIRGDDGKIRMLTGCARLAKQIGPDDVGKTFRAAYRGMKTTLAGQPWKDIAVDFWTDTAEAGPGLEDIFALLDEDQAR